MTGSPRPKDRADTESFDVQRQIHNSLRQVCIEVDVVLNTPARVAAGIPRPAKAKIRDAIDEAIRDLEVMKEHLQCG